MQPEIKEGNNSQRREMEVNRHPKIILFFGILFVNVFWFFYSFLGGSFWPVAALAVFVSLFLIFLHRSKENGGNGPDFLKKEKQTALSQADRKKELLEANNKLLKMKEEFLKTTQNLFQRDTELVQANKRLQELDAVKSEFVSVAAHQLRTPLTGVKWSYLTLLDNKTGVLNSEQKKIVESGLEAIDYAIDTINDLLNTARLDAGKSVLNPQEQPIGPVIQEVLKQHEPVLKEKHIKLNVDFPLSSPLVLKFDKEKIAIVFDNIIANAVKYTPEEGNLDLKVFREKDLVVFKIKDSGIGIPKTEQNKVFSKFFRAKNAVSFQTSGSGLGLYVAKNIIEKHGGTIDLESEEKIGTTVTFSLPVK